MYSFRFKSGTAREVAYLSKLSPTDSAAFNFTLDESQALKDLYAKKLETSAGTTAEISAALGELHEYDQEYDAARKEYHKTILIIDGKVEQLLMSKTDNTEDKAFNGHILILQQLERDSSESQQLTISFVADWATFRLRLMLKIAMTFEHTRNYERAQAYYHEAHMMSRRFLQLIFDERPSIHSTRQSRSRFIGQRKIENTLFMAKSFNILYQAAFAKAWLAEKQGTGVDTSLTILKTELFYFETLFQQFKLSEDIKNYVSKIKHGQFAHASLGLIKAEFYNKTGDLCFFKGGNLPDHNRLGSSELYKNGYLYKASYYYATSLHYLRHFNLYRQEASKVKYSTQASLEATFSPEQLPDYPLVENASALADVSEVILARVNIKALIESLVKGQRQAITRDKKEETVYLKNTDSKTTISKSFFSFMVTTSIYFDKWLKYKGGTINDEESYHHFAEVERDNEYTKMTFSYSLWELEKKW